MVFNFSQGIARSTFIATICSGDISTGEILPIFSMFNLVSWSNDFTKLPAWTDTASLELPEMVDKCCCNPLFLRLMVLWHTKELSLMHFDTMMNVIG